MSTSAFEEFAAGNYTITVALTGFKTAVLENVEVSRQRGNHESREQASLLVLRHLAPTIAGRHPR